MTKNRLDQLIIQKRLSTTRSQAENLVRMGRVMVDGQVVTKPGYFVRTDAEITVQKDEQFVSRAGLKLASVAAALNLDFAGKVMLDVGSSTGGFTDFALRRGARKVIAVDVGTDQLHPSLRNDMRIELHEKTDIRNMPVLSEPADIVVIDVSFISLREVLPSVARLAPRAQVVAMVKPQFEAGPHLKHKGVIKNDAMRRQILRDFEAWVRQNFTIVGKADSEVAGAKGNLERFYLLVVLT